MTEWKSVVVLVSIGVAREAKGPCPPKFLKNIVILCFERSFSKKNSVICPKIKHFVPPKISGLAAPLLATFAKVIWSYLTLFSMRV